MPILKVHPLRFVHQQMNPWWYLLLTLLQLHVSLILSFLPSSSSSSSSNYNEQYEKCTRTQYSCGYENYTISYPFNFLSRDRPNFCGRRGYSLICDEEKSALMLQTSGKVYQVRNIDYSNYSLTISNPAILDQVPCSSLPSLIDNNMDPSLFEFNPNIGSEISVMNCNVQVPYLEDSSIDCISDDSEMPQYFYYSFEDDSVPYPHCGITHVWMNQTTVHILKSSPYNFWEALEQGFTVTWKAGRGPPCDRCSQRGGVCTYDDTSGREACVCSYGLCKDEENNELLPTPKEKSHRKRDIAIGVSISGGFMIAMLIGLLLLYRRRKRKLRSSTILLSRNGSNEPSFSKEDAELGTYPELSVSRYHTHVFTFDELHEATDGFSASNQLGDGGFGTVYKGLLRDGRVVAVKRLFQQNYRRLEQFMNEVDILSDLRHPNLVMLYGCTSRHSRDLLLVYEYVANGTVADHLYGVKADAGFLAWPTRMSIAIQTADALAYLHDDGTQIIHRDVKTNNILLDEDFHVKVADFGLSRLFPTNATHVSTAPQGTPGYLDPEYHQCYQLTDKSDVYSFGVVLAELISSKPAVDVTRQRSEINLSNMAVNKIQKQELDQFVDPRLGYQSDYGTREMIDSVAELAFRCLQLESDMRPTMKEALEVLRGIRNRGREAETRGMKVDVEAKEDAHLLKNVPLCSPNSVTERWASVATTPNASS